MDKGLIMQQSIISVNIIRELNKYFPNYLEGVDVTSTRKDPFALFYMITRIYAPLTTAETKEFFSRNLGFAFEELGEINDQIIKKPFHELDVGQIQQFCEILLPKIEEDLNKWAKGNIETRSFPQTLTETELVVIDDDIWRLIEVTAERLGLENVTTDSFDNESIMDIRNQIIDQFKRIVDSREPDSADLEDLIINEDPRK